MSEYFKKKAKESAASTGYRATTSELKKRAANTTYSGETYTERMLRRGKESTALGEQLQADYEARKALRQPQMTPAERYAQERTANTSPNRKLNAMESRLDPGTNVRTTYSAQREWEKDTDEILRARDQYKATSAAANVNPMAANSNPMASGTPNTTNNYYQQANAIKAAKSKSADYDALSEEYRKKYNIQSDEDFDAALKYREYKVAQTEATQREAVKKAPYNKYSNLSEEDKALVQRTLGDGTGYADDHKEYQPRRRKEGVSEELEPMSVAEAYLKLQEKYSSEEIKQLRKGYKDTKKYGTPITEDEELIAKYDSLNGRARELLRSMPLDTVDMSEDVFVEAMKKELRDDYGLTDNDITQLSIYARRKKDADMGNEEFWTEAGKESAKDAKAAASIASIGSNALSSITSTAGVLRDIAENRALERAGYKGDLTLNKDNPLYGMRNYTQGIREQRAEDLNEAWETDKAAGFVYQTAMSGADSLLAMSIGSLFPAVNFGGTINGVKNTVSLGAAAAEGAAYSMGMGGLMLGMGAGVDTMLDLTEKGASAETAVMGGLVSGTFEMLFEDLSISELSTFKGIEALEMAKGWSKQAVKQNVKIAAEKILGSAVTNASEEGLTELANLIYDTLANGDMSQYAEYYNNAIASGMSTDEARKEAFKDMALQVLEAAAGGALMGVGFGVGGAVKLNAQRNTTYAMSPDGLVPVTPKMKGRAISASGRVGETLQAADVVGGTAQEYKDQLVDKVGGSSNLTDKQIGKIALETQFATEGNEEKRKALKSFREEAEVKRANYKQGTTENGNKTRYLITNSPITVDGKETTINGNNKVDTEGEVFTDGKNGLEFKTGDGRTVELTRQTASQIKNEDARNLALFAVNNNLKAKSANLLFNTYDGEFLASDHASAFLNIYRQGSLGTKNKALIKNYSESLSKFTADQVNEIMNAGLEEKKFTPGATDFRVSEKKNNFVNLQVKIMDSIAKALNKELIVTDDLFDEYTREDGTKGYRALNGTYIKGDNRIILSAKADNGLLLSFLAHEMGHEMKNIDSDAFGRLKDKVMSYYTPEEFEEMKAEFVLKGYKESEAEEEIIANALFKVWDKDTIKKVIGKNKSLAVKLYNLVDKISKTYEKAIQRFTTGTDRYGNARNADVKKLLDNKQYMDDVKEVFTEYIGNMQSGKYDTTAEGGLNAIANPAEKEVVKEFGDDLGEVITNGEGDLVLATDKNEETVMYSYSTWQDRGRDELIGLLKAKGHTATEIKDVISQIEDAADYLKILAAGDAKTAGYDALADHLIADVVTDVANGKQIVSALVPNGDYPVNIDLALICKKRVAYMKLLNYLVGEGVLEDVKFGGEAIADVNKILRDSGFETACLGCFVESRRLQIQTWAETIAQEWNAAVDKVRKNAPYFNFSDKEGVANLTEDEVNDLESWLDKQIKNDKGNVKAPGKTPTTKAGNLLKMLKKTGEGEAFNALAKKITVGDLITPQGLTKLRSVSGELFSFVKSRYGAASPKIVQDFNPYNSEIAMMTFEAVKKITGKSISGSQSYLSAAKEELADSKPPKKDKAGTEKWNADVQNLALQKYFKDIGGIRIQSFSDFMIENVFDYLQIVADLSARDFTMHGYTKEASAIRLFGMTGIKWNGSLIAHVDPKMGKEFAGLMPASEAKAHRGILVKVDGKEYSIGFDDFERHSKFDKNSFIQSIGYKDMVALQCDKRYSPYVGSICIGVSDKQIEAMLDSDLIRMIIPYHASGMLPEFANLIGVDMYTDYTNYQNTRIEKLFDVNGTPVTELVIGKDKKGKDEYAGNKQVGHFEWNAKVQELGDAKAAAKAYIEWCHEQHPVFNKKGDLIGYATYEPKFSQFSNHENYYKLLEDFNSYDSVTGVSAVQDAVKMNLPSKDNKLTAKELAEYKQALKKTGLFSDSEIEKYAKKAQMSFQDIIKESVDERIAYNKMTEPIKQETFEKVKNLLLEKYNREGNRAASIEDYLNAQKNPKTKSTLQPVEGAYGNKNSISDREYFDAIEEYGADSKQVKDMVERAAKEWGAYSNKGVPVIGYHATPYSFNAFDIEKTSQTNDLGQGIYITNDVNDAENNYAKSSGGDVQNKIESRALEIFEEMGFSEEDSYSNDYVKEYNEAYDRAENEFNSGKVMPLFFKITNPLYVKGHNLVDENGDFVVETQYADYKKLLRQGYDGIVDNTVSGKFSNIKSAETVHYVVFDNRNVKSADLETYNDEGNVIPLSDRFNLGNEDIRYSFRDMDAEYEEAYFDGDDERMQAIIDEAAIDAGYKYKAYHHTMNSFTKFDLNRARKTSDIQGFYFSADPEAESEFGDARYDVYLRMRNPYIVDSAEKAKAIPFDLSKDNSGVKARQWLLDNGYDSVIRKAEYYGAEADEYIVLNANQIKSAEPMTFSDEDGEEIIYPSQRFDDSDDDIRYSYAGNRAETADKDLLAEAEQMEKSGADSETIRQKTGWFRGYDNKWRFEIDDSKATWDNEAKLKTDVFDTGYDYIKLTDLMDHPELYKAYPELKDVKVYIRPSQATSGMVYGGSTSSIFMRKFDPSSQLWRDFVTHELQHVVQNIEEFATGASQNQYRQLDWGEKEYAAVDKRNEIADKLYAVLRRNGVSISSEAIEDNKYAWTDGFVSSIINDNYFKLQSLAERNPRTKALVDEYYEQVGTLNATTPFGQYMNTAGEIEANDVMSRRRLSADERKNRRPDIDNPNAILKGVDAAKYSYSDWNLDGYEGYDEPITLNDIKRLQKIAVSKNKPSINLFTSEDIKAARKWANKYWKLMGTNSPFFRAWFGEWKQHDDSLRAYFSEVGNISKENNLTKDNVDKWINESLKQKDLFRGDVKNKDIDSLVNVGKNIYEDTLSYAKRKLDRGGSEEEFWSELSILQDIKNIVRYSILLDTEVSRPKYKSKNNQVQTNIYSSFFHKLYSVAKTDSGYYLVKLNIEEANPDGNTINRAYNLKGIEISPVSAQGFLSPAYKTEDSGENVSLFKVSYLYSLVKTYVKDFTPSKEVSEKLVDKVTNKPKVFYHGTASDFDTFNMSEGAYGKGAYFTTSTAEAADYAIGQLEAKGIEVPEDYDDIEDWLFENGYIREYYLNVPEDQIFSSKYGSDELVAMITDPSQAKSATDNIGTYNRFNSNTKLSLSERGDIDEYEAEQLLNTAKGEDAKAIVDAVDRKLLGDAMGYGRMLGEQKRKTEQKVKEQRRKDVEYYHQRMREIRADRDQKLMALKMLQYQKEVERKEFSKRQDYKGRIIRKYEKLQKMLLHPTENQHVPADLVHSIADFLEYITPNFLQEQYRKDGTTIKKREKNNNRLMDLVYAYGKIKEEYEDVYDEEVYNLLQEASKSFGNKSIDEMDSYELSDINNLLGAIEHTIRRANKAIVEGKERDAYALARNLVRQSDEGKKKQSNFFKRILWAQLNPYSIFHAMSNYEDSGWMDMYKILNEGQLRKTQIQVDVVDAFKDLMDNKELDKLSDYKNGLVDVGLIGENNQPVKITRGFMLALYLHLQSEQNRKHIAEGGLTIPDFEKYYKGNMEAWGNEITRTLAINGDLFRLHVEQNRLRELKRASDSDEIKARYDDEIAELENQINELRADADKFMDDIMVRIESQLTGYERKLIDKARWFFNDYSKKTLNDATMRMYGFKKASEENYMPIISDSDFLNAQFESVVRDASLENMGFMKERVKGANNAIKLFDLTDVINAQLNKVSKYAGLAPAIKEFNNVYNKKFFTDGRKTSVQEASKRRFGVYGQNYIEYLLADLQGGRKAKGSTKVFSQLRGNSYQAALLLNLRVSMAQAASYPTAAAEIGWEPLRKALLKGGKDGKIISKADRKLIDVYTPLLANRFTGGSSTDITNVKNTNLHTLSGINNRILQRTRAATDWIQMVDTATVGRLWSAAEYYVDEHYNLEKGSKEEIENGQSKYYKKVAEVFNRIVERTQPSYTTMQRPELLRNPNEMLKMFTMFMTQRAQNFNLVYDSVGKFLHENEKRKSGVYDVTDYAEAKSAMGRAVASQAIAGVTLAVMKAAADAIQHNMKGYKDDDDDITLWSVLERIFKTFLESEVSNMVGGSELFSFVESAITKSTYYGITANVAGSIEDMSTAISNLFKNGVNAKSLTRVATSSGMIIGIPASQMKKWIEMFVGWGQDIADGGEIYSNAGSSSAKNASTKMVKQYLDGDMEGYRKTRESLKGENASTVKTHISTYLRENYVDGKLTDNEVRRVLEYVYGMSSSNINNKLEEFRQRKNGTYEKKESKKWGEE